MTETLHTGTLESGLRTHPDWLTLSVPTGTTTGPAMTPLQKMVADRRAELGLSLRDVEKRSTGRDGRALVSHATINKIELGIHSGRFSEETLRGLALGLRLDVEKLRTAAGKTRAAPDEFRLPKKASRLNDKQRRAVLLMVNALLDDEDEGKA